jgi:DNA-binding LacI/PurR family transcriptional regulator
MNYRKGVGAKTAERIREYAQKIGYRPSHMARVLSNGKTRTIGLCLRNSPKNPWLSGILDELNQAVRQAGYTLNIMLTNGELPQIREALQQLAEHRVEATIIGPLGYTQEYMELATDLAQLPNVLAFEAVDNLPIDHCMNDVYQGGMLAMQHLMQLGHQHIGYIGAQEMEVNIPGVRNRYAAYRDALAYQNLPFEPDWLITDEQCCLGWNDDRIDNLVEMLTRLREQKKWPTAWFCHNDWGAAQMIQALNEMGLAVPGDVSLVGFDNQMVGHVTMPKITTVGFDLKTYVDQIIRLVLNRLNEKSSDTQTDTSAVMQRSVTEPTLMVRQSTGPVCYSKQQ